MRGARKVHRLTGALLFVFFFIVAITGLILGWKKNTGGYILAETHKGKSTDAKGWLPIHELQTKAIGYARERISADISDKIDRIDVRPDKGMVKFVFVEAYWGVQVDMTTGELLHIERRRSDFFEHIHDGTIVDALLGFESGQFKLVYTTIMGTALLTFTISGFWLWYGPKRFKAGRSISQESIS